MTKERTKLVLERERRWNEAEGGPANMARALSDLRVSRQTGYTSVARSRAADLEVPACRALAPTQDVPTAISVELEDFIVDARETCERRPNDVRQESMGPSSG